MSKHLSSLTGAYAVDALTGEELAEFERHLAECDDCAREVRDLRETAARLALATAAPPPADLKRRVLDEVARTRQEPPETAAEPEPARSAEVVPLTRRRRWATRIAVAAAVAGLALAGTFGTIAWQNQQELADVRQQMAQAGARGAEMARVLAAPDARLLTATGEGGVSGSTVVSASLGKAMFMGSDTPALPAGRAYQLWFITSDGAGKRFVSAGVLSRTESGRTSPVVLAVPQGTAGMGVTVEPAGGSPQPTTDPVLQMTVPA